MAKEPSTNTKKDLQKQMELPSCSISWHPLLFIYNFFQSTAELRIGTNMGVAIVVGIGRLPSKPSVAEGTYQVFELGAQFRYYERGNFKKGTFIGGQAHFMHASDASEPFTDPGSAFSLGAFVGYKYSFWFVFMLELRLGYEFFLVKPAPGHDSETVPVGIPIINLNLGFNF